MCLNYFVCSEDLKKMHLTFHSDFESFAFIGDGDDFCFHTLLCCQKSVLKFHHMSRFY